MSHFFLGLSGGGFGRPRNENQSTYLSGDSLTYSNGHVSHDRSPRWKASTHPPSLLVGFRFAVSWTSILTFMRFSRLKLFLVKLREFLALAPAQNLHTRTGEFGFESLYHKGEFGTPMQFITARPNICVQSFAQYIDG